MRSRGASNSAWTETATSSEWSILFRRRFGAGPRSWRGPPRICVRPDLVHVARAGFFHLRVDCHLQFHPSIEGELASSGVLP